MEGEGFLRRTMNLVKGGQSEIKQIGKVVICTPSLDGNFSIEYHQSLVESIFILQSLNIAVDRSIVRGDCFIGKSRNHLVNLFYEQQGESLFFVDADQGWDAKAFVRMVLDHHEIVAGAVPKKADKEENGEMQFNNVDLVTNEKSDCYVENGLLQARSVGTGFMRIKKSALDKFIKAYPEKYNAGDGSKDFHHRIFESGIINGQFWGEDLYFCKKWCDLGEKLWIDPNIDFSHVGRKVYTGNYLQYLQSRPTYTITLTQPQQLAA